MEWFFGGPESDNLDNARYELGFEIQALQDEALSLGVKIL